MARIQLRDSTIFIRDGLSGAAAVNDAAASAGDATLAVDAVVLNTTTTDQVPVGARFTVAGETGTPIHTVTGRTPGSGTTTDLNITPVLATGGVADDAVITFLPQQIEIKVGEGDITWKESRELLYDLDRDRLDTVRLGKDIPLEIDLNFTFEYVTTESGKAITPYDAIKQRGEASEWVSSSSDLCEPYAVNIFIIRDVACGTDQDEDYLFQDFRQDDLDFSIKDASIGVKGRCNVTEVTSTRGDFS